MNSNETTPVLTSAKYRQRAVTCLKVVFVFGLLYFLVRKGFISIQATQQALQQWQKIIPAVAVCFLAALLGVVRWQWLLRAQDIHLGWTKTFQLTFIGSFFNIALPGAVSGDFVKAFYVGKETHGHRARAFGSILFDRVAGLSALALVSAIAILIGLKSYLHSPLMNAIQYSVGTGAICVLAFYTYLFTVREHRDPVLRVLKKLESSIPKLSAVRSVYEGLRHYHNHRLQVLKVVLISAVIHIAIGWACFLFAQALGETNISLLSLYVIVPVGLLVTAVPVAPAGVGTGNVAFLYLFHLLGSARGADVYSLYALTNIIIGCFGGIIYSRYRVKAPAIQMEPVPLT